jgi:hypothetical protein
VQVLTDDGGAGRGVEVAHGGLSVGRGRVLPHDGSFAGGRILQYVEGHGFLRSTWKVAAGIVRVGVGVGVAMGQGWAGSWAFGVSVDY